jgi:hypothetical protein
MCKEAFHKDRIILLLGIIPVPLLRVLILVLVLL